jgi:hypothetical protein
MIGSVLGPAAPGQGGPVRVSRAGREALPRSVLGNMLLVSQAECQRQNRGAAGARGAQGRRSEFG